MAWHGMTCVVYFYQLLFKHSADYKLHLLNEDGVGDDDSNVCVCVRAKQSAKGC